MIHAKKQLGEKIIKRTFTPTAWKLMGKDKGGWKINPNETEAKKPKELDGGKEEDSGDAGGSKESTVGIANITVANVIVALKQLNTVEEIKAYVGNDARGGVEKAVAKRISEIEELSK